MESLSFTATMFKTLSEKYRFHRDKPFFKRSLQIYEVGFRSGQLDI